MISKEDIKKVADLSMINLSEQDIKCMEEKLVESIQRVEILGQANTDGVEPLLQVHEPIEEFRKDLVEVDYILDREEVLVNTKEQQYGYFKLLNIMD